MSQDNSQPKAEPDLAPDPALRALDGMLRELARAGTGTDDAFVQRVMTAVRESDAETATGAVAAPLSAPHRVSQAQHRLAIPQLLAALVRTWRANVRPAWTTGLALACVALVAATLVIHCLTATGPSMCKVMDRELRYQVGLGRKLGLYVAEKYAGAKALVIVPPTVFGDGERRRNAVVDGLKEGFGGAITVVAEASPERPPVTDRRTTVGVSTGESGIPADMAAPQESYFTAEVFDRLVKKYAGKVDLVVTTIGLPQDMAKMEFWHMSSRPRLALAGGSVHELKNAFSTGAIVAAVAYSPCARYSDKPPASGVSEAFAERFLLITPENIEEISRQFPELFME